MSLKTHWENASPTTKKRVIIGTIIAGFAVFASLIAITDSNKPRRRTAGQKPDTTIILPQKRNTDLESVSALATALDRRLRQIESTKKTESLSLKEQIQELHEEVRKLGKGGKVEEQILAINARIDALTKSSASHQTPSVATATPPSLPPPLNMRTAVTPPVAAPVTTTQLTPPAHAAPTSVPESPAPKLRIIGEETDASESAKTLAKSATDTLANVTGGATTRDRKDQKNTPTSTWLPAGSIIQGVLLNGLDAPTSGASQKNPTPVLIRIKHNAILPSHANMDVKECFIIASGFGVMSTERAQMRTETLSCVRPDGGVIEAKLDGYIIGEDGKVGMRGRLVSKQGSVIAQSLVSGFFSGIGAAMRPQQVPGLNLNPGGQVQTQQTDMGAMFESGAYGGVSTSLNQISKFYLDIAKEMVPVVEIDAGRATTIVLVRGSNIKLSK